MQIFAYRFDGVEFAGLELALLIRDVTGKNELFIVLFIAGIGFATTNMGIAFFLGILLRYLINPDYS